VRYPVGTNPVSVTIADINGDGIPDMLVADQGSNDVSILFGSIVNGHWVGTPGPRLSSGGLGPIAVNVIDDPNSPGGHDLAITNGQSGTVAILRGRGQGFFDDRNPIVVSLGALIVQPPSFGPGGTGVAVTTTGQLLGFDLNDLAAGATVVSPAGQDVLAAEELNDGDVLAAEADGSVSLLKPEASGLELSAVLVPLTGVPLAASALEAIQTPTGLEALVTSAGQDTIFVFGLSPNLPAPQPEPVPIPALEAPSILVAAPSSVEEAPLVLAVILMAPSLTEANASANVGGDDDGPFRVEEGGLAGLGEAGSGPAWRPGLEKALEQLDLFRPLENRRPTGLQSRLEAPWQDESWDLASLGEGAFLLVGPGEDVGLAKGGPEASEPNASLAQAATPELWPSAGEVKRDAGGLPDIREQTSAVPEDFRTPHSGAGASEWSLWGPIFQGLLAVLATTGLGGWPGEESRKQSRRTIRLRQPR
jgi:hypothetical protein